MNMVVRLVLGRRQQGAASAGASACVDSFGVTACSMRHAGLGESPCNTSGYMSLHWQSSKHLGQGSVNCWNDCSGCCVYTYLRLDSAACCSTSCASQAIKIAMSCRVLMRARSLAATADGVCRPQLYALLSSAAVHIVCPVFWFGDLAAHTSPAGRQDCIVLTIQKPVLMLDMHVKYYIKTCSRPCLRTT